MFELISAHKTGRKAKFLPNFAVKSWEDKILGALVRCRRKRIKDHAKLKTRPWPCFFLLFSSSPAKQRRRIRHLAVCQGDHLQPMREGVDHHEQPEIGMLFAF
ncbi:hypothetical protein [Sinorhizobium sojae]|uniref:hypothetical protein n=1 Tax=Sinorhizobium sojae TaxID=716925 RepID=UPI001389D269|nr:hypothetical protein [Sinorhizobium sojae]